MGLQSAKEALQYGHARPGTRAAQGPWECITMTENQPPTSDPQPPPKREPLGPGPMMAFGLGLLVVAAWCGWDLYAKEDWVKEGRTGTIIINWCGLIGACIGAIYCFLLAAKRSKKPQDETARDRE